MKGVYRDTFLRVFPPPHFLTMPSVGVDVSDHSVKFIEFKRTQDGLEVGRFGEHAIPDGVMVSGKIHNPAALKEVLVAMRKEHKLHFVRATLPEESGYLFELSLPDMPEDEMESAIAFRLEENVPIAPEESVFGYDLIRASAGADRSKKKQKRVVVSAFPKAVAETYAQLFHEAGLVPLALETEPQATARSVVPYNDLQTHLIVDFGRERSGISIVGGGAVRFGTTTEVGGDEITEAFVKQFGDHTPEDIERMKNKDGLRLVTGNDDEHFQRDVVSVLDGIVRDVRKHVQYWNTHAGGRSRGGHIAKVLLCGGNANIGGLPEYLSQQLKLPVSRANVWVNAFSLERYLPKELSFNESLGYAPAIGLALGGVPRMAPR